MRWLFLGLIVLQAASCGQKGPLYLPGEGDAAHHTAAAGGPG